MHDRAINILSVIQEWKGRINGCKVIINVDELENPTVIDIVPQNEEACQLGVWISDKGGAGYRWGDKFRFDDEDNFYSDEKEFLWDLLESIYEGNIEEEKWYLENEVLLKTVGIIHLKKSSDIRITRCEQNLFSMLIYSFYKKKMVKRKYAPY